MTQLPRSEYPRPNFRWDQWLCLNGEWDFSIGQKSFDRKIIVPYAYETALSGIEDKSFYKPVWYENLSVPQIAELCNMSQICLQQTFSKYAGMGIIKYFNRLKIEKAIKMLQKGSSVQETADALGFSSQNYFSTTFKRITGKTPTSYKQRFIFNTIFLIIYRVELTHIFIYKMWKNYCNAISGNLMYIFHIL